MPSRLTGVLLTLVLLGSGPARAAGAAVGDRPAGEESCRVVAPPGREEVASELGLMCRERLPRVLRQLGLPSRLDAPVEVRVALDPNGMAALAPPGLKAPPWSGAVAYPEHGVLVLSLRHHDGRPVEDPATALVHELSHLAMRRALGGHDVPRWFSEGIAIQQSGESQLARLWTLLAGSAADRVLPLAVLERYPEQPGEVDLAYAQAADFAGFLLRQRGWIGVREALRRIAGGEPFEEALEGAFGASVAALEAGWRAGLAERWDWIPILTGSGALWGVATLVFLLAWRFSVRRRKRRLVEMGKDEAAVDRVIAAAEEAKRKVRLAGRPIPLLPQPPVRTKIRVDGEIHTLH